MIPFCRPIHDDEFFYGWQASVAELNGLTPDEFRHAYFNPDRVHFTTDGIRYLRIDYPSALRKCLEKHGSQLPDADTLLKRHSFIYETFPFISHMEQAGLINEIFNTCVGSSFNATSSRHMLTRMRFCPECAAEDRRNGTEPYFRTVHQMPYVDACPEHGCALREISVTLRDQGKMSVREMMETSAELPLSGSRSAEISRFYADMYENPVNISKAELSDIIKEKLLAEGFFKNDPLHDIKRIDRLLEETGYSGHGISGNDFMKYVSGNRKSEKKAYLCLPFLFGTYGNFYTEALKHVRERNEGFYDFCEGRYDVLDDYGRIIRLKCRRCGSVFYMHPYGPDTGLECPVCDLKLTPEEVVARQLKLAGDGGYELLEPFKGYGSRHAVLHRTCGKTAQTVLSERIWQGHTCSCESQTSIESLQKRVDNISEGFRVMDFRMTSSSNCQVLLRHEGGCSGTFWLDMKNFVTRPFCRCCKGKTLEDFRADVSAISEGFELLGIRYNDSPAPAYRLEYHLKHLKCGADFWLPAVLFESLPYCRACESEDRPNAKTQECFDRIRKGFIVEKRWPSRKNGPPAKYTLRHAGTEDEPGCGETFTTTLALFKRSCNCRVCETEDTAFTGLKERFDADFPGFEAVGRGSREGYINVRHKACGGVFEIRPDMFRREPACRLCEEYGSRKDTLAEAQAKIDAVSEGFEVVSIDRTDSKNPVYRLKHTAGCGKEFDIEARLFKKSPYCRACEKHTCRSKSLADIQAEIDSISEGFELISVDRSNPKSPKYKLKHVGGCGETFDVKAQYFRERPYCRKCQK